MLPTLNRFTKELDKLKRISLDGYQDSVKKADSEYSVYLSALSEFNQTKSVMCKPQIIAEEAKVDKLYAVYQELKSDTQFNLIFLKSYVRASEQANHSLIELQQKLIQNLTLLAESIKDALDWEQAFSPSWDDFENTFGGDNDN